MTAWKNLVRASVGLLILAGTAFAQVPVKQSGTNITPNTVPWWITSGVIGGGVTSADSPVTSFGVTNNGGCGISVASQRITAAGRQLLCFGVSDTGGAVISLQNYGNDTPAGFAFVINGTTYPFPGNSVSRTILVAPTTYYVSTTGSDANNCSGTAPCATIQHVYNLLATSVDMAGQLVTVQLANGTYTSGLIATQQTVGQGGPANLVFQGNVGSPSSVVISTSNADAFTCTNNGTGAITGFFVTGVTLQTATSGNGIGAWGGGCQVIFGNVNFGSIAGDGIFATHSAFVIQQGNAYSISGNANAHAVASVNATIALHGATITFSNSPVFSGSFVQAVTNGNIFVDGMTFTNGNTVTGQKFQVYTNGNIEVSNGEDETYLPGTIQGVATGGGQYSEPTLSYTIPGQFKDVSANYAATVYDRVIMGDATLGSITITLPAVSNNTQGTVFAVRKLDSSANTVTVVCTGSCAFNQSGTYVISKQNAGVEFISFGTQWYTLWNGSDWVGNSVPLANGGTGATTGPTATYALNAKGAFASLPSCAAGLQGATASITDSTTNTWGATISGSGSDPVLGWCNGTNWTVVGK